MASDLDVTTAVWGTENVEPADNEVANPAYRTTVARDVGYVYYMPKFLLNDEGAGVFQVAGAGTGVTESYYSPTGLFAVYGKVYTSSETLGSARLKIDGTTLVDYVSGSGWSGTTITFVGTIAPTLRHWVGGVYDGHNSSGTWIMNSAYLFIAGI